MQAAQDSTAVRIIRGFAVSLMIAGGREFEILQPCCLHPGQLTMSGLLIGCCRGNGDVAARDKQVSCWAVRILPLSLFTVPGAPRAHQHQAEVLGNDRVSKLSNPGALAECRQNAVIRCLVFRLWMSWPVSMLFPSHVFQFLLSSDLRRCY